MSKKLYVLDTNVYLTDFNSMYSFGNNDIVVPMIVLEEVDKHKKRQDGVGMNARQFIRALDELRSKGDLHEGVRLGKGKGIMKVGTFDSSLLPHDFDPKHPDNIIICTALTLKRDNPEKKVILISRDVNVRVKCDAVGLTVEDYVASQIVDKAEEVYTGFETHLVDDEVINRFYGGEKLYITEAEKKLCPNQYVMLISNANEKRTALARFKNYNHPLFKVNEYKQGLWEVKSRNKEQTFALDMLMNPDIKLVSLIGTAGCGKTLMAIAAGLHQVLNVGKAKGGYDYLIVSRPVQPMGKDIGFLPGTMEEKMAPWIAPIEDNLKFLLGNDKDALQRYMELGTIEVEALTYIRGRSIANAFIIIDEAQNLSMHELKTIITRVGENTKIVLTGDIEQIDNIYVDATTNGLTYAVEKFKDYEIAGHISLQKGERSELASLAASIL